MECDCKTKILVELCCFMDSGLDLQHGTPPSILICSIDNTSATNAHLLSKQCLNIRLDGAKLCKTMLQVESSAQWHNVEQTHVKHRDLTQSVLQCFSWQQLWLAMLVMLGPNHGQLRGTTCKGAEGSGLQCAVTCSCMPRLYYIAAPLYPSSIACILRAPKE